MPPKFGMESEANLESGLRLSRKNLRQEFTGANTKSSWSRIRIKREMANQYEVCPDVSQQKVSVYGDIQPPLDEDELECLRLPINFTSYQRLSRENLRQDFTGAHTKSRWSRIGM